MPLGEASRSSLALPVPGHVSPGQAHPTGHAPPLALEAWNSRHNSLSQEYTEPAQIAVPAPQVKVCPISLRKCPPQPQLKRLPPSLLNSKHPSPWSPSHGFRH